MITNTGTTNSSGGGNISGLITGNGWLNLTAGTLDITGIDGNNYTGLTTIGGGTLRLNNRRATRWAETFSSPAAVYSRPPTRPDAEEQSLANPVAVKSASPSITPGAKSMAP